MMNDPHSCFEMAYFIEIQCAVLKSVVIFEFWSIRARILQYWLC